MKKDTPHGKIKSAPGRSGHKYVHPIPKRRFSKARWRVMIPMHGVRKPSGKGFVQKNIGYFRTLEEAITARDNYLNV